MSKDDAGRLDEMLKRQESKCHWCGCRIVRTSSLDKSKIVIEQRNFVVWRSGDRTQQALIASAVSLDGNGTYAAACKKCSEEQPKVVKKMPVPPKATGADRVVFW